MAKTLNLNYHIYLCRSKRNIHGVSLVDYLEDIGFKFCYLGGKIRKGSGHIFKQR